LRRYANNYVKIESKFVIVIKKDTGHNNLMPRPDLVQSVQSPVKS